MAYCTKCGNRVEDDDRFCTKCGQPVEARDVSGETREVASEAAPASSGDGYPETRDVSSLLAEGDSQPEGASRHGSDTIDVSELDMGGFAGVGRGVEQIRVVPSAGRGVRTDTRSVEEIGKLELPKGATEGVDAPSGRKPSAKVAGVALAVIVVAAAVVVALVQFGSCSSSDGSGSDAATEASAESAGASSGGDESGASAAKAALADYSWDELSDIADEISAAADPDAALQVAISYNLAGPDGSIDASQVKDVELAGGRSAQVRIVDFYHDSKSNGSGKAGITFMFTQCVADRPMNSNGGNYGGWETSEGRSWLNDDFYDKLPSELRKVVVAVDKESNNVGVTRSLDAVTNTSDKVWLPSMCEIAGQADVILDHGGVENDDYNSVLKAEGSQYRIFSDAGIRARKSNKTLKRSYDGDKATWWLRSPSPGNAKLFRAVDEAGDPSEFGFADRDHGFVPCFCL